MTNPESSIPNPGSIAFIGGGNMARSLIGGMVERGLPAERIAVAEPQAALREALADDFGVQAHARGAEAAAGAATWVLAVKPQVMREVCAELAAAAAEVDPLVVSIAAGITTDQLDRWLGGGRKVVRSMPNTPALLGAGVTGLFANARVDETGRVTATTLMTAVGQTVWIPEERLMDAVTAVSGSGPAYFFLLAEAMQAAGEAQGLPPEVASELVLHTALGAARMLVESGETAATLRQRVTSPGGTTQAALEVFEAGGLRLLTDRAINAATLRGQELSRANEDAAQ